MQLAISLTHISRCGPTRVGRFRFNAAHKLHLLDGAPLEVDLYDPKSVARANKTLKDVVSNTLALYRVLPRVEILVESHAELPATQPPVAVVRKARKRASPLALASLPPTET